MPKVDKYDICVIGAGAAGIIFVLEFTKLNPEKTILLIEFGNQNSSSKNSLDDSIEITNPINHHLPYECTNKGFGGSTAIWGGRCVMYDEIDFINRPILNGGCTWNLDLFNDVSKYINQTSVYFECGDSGFDLNEIDDFKDRRIVDNFK